MSGHYGVERVTTGNLEIVEVRLSENLLLIKGAVPGSNGGLVVIKAAKKAVYKKGGK
jgi:large subunit ribosomal protein L3